MSYTYQYPHPAVATDCVVFGFDGKEIRILLIERGVEPYKGSWAFPGGFMRMDETAEACARRKLSEETNLMVYTLKQFGTFTEVHRDPRERVISIAYYALVRPADVVGGDDATQARWFRLDDVPRLAFDHDYILRKALQQIRKDIHFEPVGFELLDNAFTMSELQRLYESILGIRFDRRNFEKKMLQTGILQLVEEDPADEPSSVAPDPVFFGRNHEMRSKSIDSLFGAEPLRDFCSLENDVLPYFNGMADDLEEDASVAATGPACNMASEHSSPELHRKKPGRKGRKYSFNKDKYDRFKQDNNFRLEF